MAKYDDLDTNQIFIIGISSVVVTLVTILAVQYVYFLMVAGHQDLLQAQSSYARQNRELAQQVTSVSEYGADPATGNVTIPIEEAMALVAREAQAHADEADHDAGHEEANDAT